MAAPRGATLTGASCGVPLPACHRHSLNGPARKTMNFNVNELSSVIENGVSQKVRLRVCLSRLQLRDWRGPALGGFFSEGS
eukprot:scaffold23253_cov69-Phaeocystis_antarctica.AAC.4